jgi:hypothetical protein
MPTRWRYRGRIVDPPCPNACRALHQPIGYPLRCFVTRAKTSETSQFSVIRRSTGIRSHPSESCYRSFKVYTSCVNRCASWSFHIRLSRKKLQENSLHMISIDVSSLAAHNTCSAAQTNVAAIVMSTITVVWLVSSLPLYFYTMTSHRDIYIYNR